MNTNSQIWILVSFRFECFSVWNLKYFILRAVIKWVTRQMFSLTLFNSKTESEKRKVQNPGRINGILWRSMFS